MQGTGVSALKPNNNVITEEVSATFYLFFRRFASLALTFQRRPAVACDEHQKLGLLVL